MWTLWWFNLSIICVFFFSFVNYCKTIPNAQGSDITWMRNIFHALIYYYSFFLCPDNYWLALMWSIMFPNKLPFHIPLFSICFCFFVFLKSRWKLRQCTHTKATNPQTTLDMRTGVSSSTLVSCGCNVKFCRDSGNRSRYPSESRGWRGGEVCQRSITGLPHSLKGLLLPVRSAL